VDRSAPESWNAVASGWERWRAALEETTRPVTDWLLRELAPEAGETILELAAGPGDTGFAAAGLVGERGRLISTDFSPAMVEVARRRAAELGVTNVEHRTIDAERIELGDDSVDGVLCRFGYMLMPDPAAALSETRRVLRDGGRLALAVWASAEEKPWTSILGRILVERRLVPPPEPGTPGPFALADEELLRATLEGAGFAVRRLEQLQVLHVYRDLDDYVHRLSETARTFSAIWRDASDELRDALRADFADAFAPYAVDGGYELPGVAVCVVAR
jgi:SAM-dependent methyltransferase